MSGNEERGMAATEVDALLRRALDERLEALAFDRVRERGWVRCRVPHVRDLFEIQILKSGARILVWGWSLDYVPHIVGRRGLRWHRTAKSARFDLRFDPIDYARSGGLLRWTVPFGWGTPVEESHQLAKAVVGRALTEAPKFWDGVKSIADLPRAFQEKRDRPFTRFGFENYVQEPLAEAFTFAALGQRRSRVLLEAYIEQFSVDPVAAEGLRERLAQRLETPLHPGAGG